MWKPSVEPRSLSIDKAWHVIHFLLTGTGEEGSGPLAFILDGGSVIDEDMMFGPAHGFNSTEVEEISTALKEIEYQHLAEKFDLSELSKNKIYPEVWKNASKEEELDWFLWFYKELKKFVNETAQSKHALITYLG